MRLPFSWAMAEFGRPPVGCVPTLPVMPPGPSLASPALHPVPDAGDGIMQGFPPPPGKQVMRGSGLRPPFMRWALSHTRELAPTVGIRHAAQPMPLPEAPGHQIDDLTLTVAGRSLRVDDYLRATHTDGFIVLHRGRVVYEKYFGGFHRHQPHIWASMTKSVTGLLASMLISEGKLDPHAPLRQYVPELEGNPFGDATVQRNLDMEVPVGYPQELPPDLGLFGAVGIVPRKDGAPDNIYDFLQITHATGAATDAPIWYYQNGSAEAIAWALRRLAGQRWSELVTDRIWSRMADDDAYASVDRLGTEMASGGLNSTLRDAARFAEAVRRAMQGDPAGPIPPAAVRIAFQPADNQSRFARGNLVAGRDGYGYRNYWFQCNDGDGSVEASGRFGQRIYINPRRDVVAVKFASSPDDAARPTSAADIRRADDPARVLETSAALIAAVLAVQRSVMP
ncbi:serine hydrolase [Cupriavidus sp. D384]|uniref:serine hydrolase domain-containing protein n=1 Tax=Cupriavidus sp. D384 TaxID=1538095 RepID=UPI0009ECF045|nr:serine hydrolase domain-containing protein [Cupriavidus sp. D384]